MDNNRIFRAIVVIGLVLLITLGAVFSEAIFRSVYEESGEIHEAGTLEAYYQVFAWIYVIAAFLIIAVLVIVFKLWYL
jgi:hypothetical protein